MYAVTDFLYIKEMEKNKTTQFACVKQKRYFVFLKINVSLKTILQYQQLVLVTCYVLGALTHKRVKNGKMSK